MLLQAALLMKGCSETLPAAILDGTCTDGGGAMPTSDGTTEFRENKK